MNQSFSVTMRRYEIIGGIIFFVVYQFLMGHILSFLMGLLGFPTDEISLNAAYYIVNFIITALLFRRFLAYSLPIAADHFLKFLKALVMGFVLYEGFQVLTVMIATFIFPSFVTPNDDVIRGMAGQNYRVMWVGAVLLAPIVEETLVRGLIFSNIRRKNRLLSYILTALVFAALHILSYILDMDVLSILLNLLVYGLPSIALCACYEMSGTIWAPIALHMIINAIAMTGI